MSYTLPQPATEARIEELLEEIRRVDTWLEARKSEFKSFGYSGNPRDPEYGKALAWLKNAIELCEDLGREFFGDEWDAEEPEELKAQPFDPSFGDAILRRYYG
jgi:hypothetical protein